MRALLAAVVVVVFGLAVAGVGMGSAPSGDPAPSAKEIAAGKARLASVRAGAEAFESAGCDTCHAIAATGAKGKLGPRLDTLGDDDVQGIEESITDPRQEIVKGYEAKLMPTDYKDRLRPSDIKAIATFIKRVSAKGD